LQQNKLALIQTYPPLRRRIWCCRRCHRSRRRRIRPRRGKN